MNVKNVKKYMCRYEKYSFFYNRFCYTKSNIEDIPLYLIADEELSLISIELGGLTIDKIYPDFCNKITRFLNSKEHKNLKKKYPDKFIYKLPFTILKNNSLNNAMTCYHEIRIIIKGITENLNINCILINHISYMDLYDPNENNLHYYYKKLCINSKEFNKQYKCFNNTEGFWTNKTNKIIQRYSVKGIFFDKLNLTDIESLELEISFNLEGTSHTDKGTRFKYTKEELKYIVEKFTNDCFYLSFDNSSFTDNNMEGSLNTYYTHDCDLTVISKKDIRFNTHFLYNKKIKYLNGLGTIVNYYDKSSTNPKAIETKKTYFENAKPKTVFEPINFWFNNQQIDLNINNNLDEIFNFSENSDDNIENELNTVD